MDLTDDDAAANALQPDAEPARVPNVDLFIPSQQEPRTGRGKRWREGCGVMGFAVKVLVGMAGRRGCTRRQMSGREREARARVCLSLACA